jgi:hypothetical protein
MNLFGRSVSLDVRHVWQLDPESKVPAERRRTVCAPVVVNIILDFMLGRVGKVDFELNTIIEQMEQHGGRVAGAGWKHSAGVATLKENGLLSWRRNWYAPSQDPSYFIEHEDYDQDQVDAFLSQLHAEESVGDRVEDKALFCIINSLHNNCPVIASVKAGFSENEGYHQVVIAGYGKTDGKDWLEIIDPLLPAERQTKVDLGYFYTYYKFQSIFVAPLTH